MTHPNDRADCPAARPWSGRILLSWLFALIRWFLALWRPVALMPALSAEGVTTYPSVQTVYGEDAGDTARSGRTSLPVDSAQGGCAGMAGWGGWTGRRDRSGGAGFAGFAGRAGGPGVI